MCNEVINDEPELSDAGGFLIPWFYSWTVIPNGIIDESEGTRTVMDSFGEEHRLKPLDEWVKGLNSIIGELCRKKNLAEALTILKISQFPWVKVACNNNEEINHSWLSGKLKSNEALNRAKENYKYYTSYLEPRIEDLLKLEKNVMHGMNWKDSDLFFNYDHRIKESVKYHFERICLLYYLEVFKNSIEAYENASHEENPEQKDTPVINRLLEENRIMQNADGTYTPTVSLNDVIGYFIDHDIAISAGFCDRYFRDPKCQKYKAAKQAIKNVKENKKTYLE